MKNILNLIFIIAFVYSAQSQNILKYKPSIFINNSISYRTLKLDSGGEIPSKVFQSRNKNEIPIYCSALGLQTTFILNKKWDLRTGLGLTHYGYEKKRGTTTFPMDKGFVLPSTFADQRLRYVFFSFNPALIFKLKKRFFVSAGYSMNYLFCTKSKFSNPIVMFDGFETKFSNHNLKAYHRALSSLSLSFGKDFNFKHLGINLNLNVHYFLTPAEKDKRIREYLCSAGIGAAFYFNK